MLPFPGGGLLVVEDVFDEGGFLQRRIGRLLPLLRPWLEVEGKFADGVLEFVEVAPEALPSVLHRVEQLVLEHEVTAATFVEDPTKRVRIEVDGDGRQLIVAGVWADDRALDSHGGSFYHRDTEARREEFNWVSLFRLPDANELFRVGSIERMTDCIHCSPAREIFGFFDDEIH